VNRPEQEPGFRVVRQEKNDRAVSYTVEPYVHQQPELKSALEVWKDITFDFESTDTADKTAEPTATAS
jgi:hypothetical protein